MLRSDNRRQERVPVRFPVIQFIDLRRVEAEALDFSYGGVGIKTVARSLVGNRYTLAFELPDSQGMILAGVEVAHESNGFEGLRFVDMTSNDRQRFHKWVDVQMAGRWFQA